MNRIRDLRFPILFILSIHVNYSFLNVSFRDDTRPLGERVRLLVCVCEAEECGLAPVRAHELEADGETL